MRRAAFVKANKERWKEFEALVNSNNPDPDQLADLFIQITDDLAFANTQYPNTDTARYLNHLASNVHLKIYRNKREEKSRLITFWTREVPLLFYMHRWKLLVAFLIFTVSCLIGAVSAANDETFVRLILSDIYVDKTLENIEKGEPMAIYSSMRGTDMFFGITFNNIRVSFTAFAWGGVQGGFPMFLFLSIGSGFVLMANGIMLGSFQYFFFAKGLLLESALTIWIHGTIEIASIIMAGAAGIVAGNSILFPGTYRRIDSMIKGVRDGLKMVIGLVPLFIIAGFLESYVTRLFEMHLLLKGTIIFVSLIFILYYFIYYPIKIAKKHGAQ